SPRRRARARTAHYAGAYPAAARRSDRGDLSAGAQVRARDQPHLGRPVIRDRTGAERAGQLFLRRLAGRECTADQRGRADVPGTGAQFCADPERTAPGSAEPVGPRPGGRGTLKDRKRGEAGRTPLPQRPRQSGGARRLASPITSAMTKTTRKTKNKIC